MSRTREPEMVYLSLDWFWIMEFSFSSTASRLRLDFYVHSVINQKDGEAGKNRCYISIVTFLSQTKTASIEV